MIDDEFSTGEPEWHVVRLRTLERHNQADTWLRDTCNYWPFNVVWGRGYYDFYLRDENLALELKLRFG